MEKTYHKTTFWTKTDDFIEEVAEWMNTNLGSSDFIDLQIKVIGKDDNIRTLTIKQTLGENNDT